MLASSASACGPPLGRCTSRPGSPLNRLPAWLTRCRVIGMRQHMLVVQGLSVLLDASFLAGAGHRHNDYRLLLASQTVPDGRIGAFQRRLGISQDVLNSSAKFLAEIERTRRIKTPAKIKLAAAFLAQGEYVRFLELCQFAVQAAMEDPYGPSAKVTPRDLVRIGEWHSVRQEARPDAQAFEFWSQPIPDLIKAAHEALARSHGENNAVDECDLDSLMILGASCSALRTVQECKWCYRWSLPGSELCAGHTLSRHAGADPRVRQREYRRGQLADQCCHRRLAEGHSDEPSAKKVPLLRRGHAGGDDLRLFVARVLWRATGPEEQTIASRLFQLIRGADISEVLELQTEALTISGVDDFLRQHFEPGQWLPVHWEWKLQKAALLRREERCKTLAAETPTNQGLEARLDAALQVAVKHRCHSLTEVATHLDVDPSTVSQWLRRSSSTKVAKLRELIAKNHFRRPEEHSIA